MRCIPFYPLYKLVRIIFINKGVSLRGMLHMVPWLVKTILLEPLRWIELIVFERKIARHSMHPSPVFILGHYRSGTTYLQQLMMQDKRLGHMSIFQSALPELMLAFEKILTPAAEHIVRFFKMKNPFHRLPFTWNFPGEDDVGMTALLSEHGAQWGMLFPRRMQVLAGKFITFRLAAKKEKTAWQQDYLYLLKKISLHNNGRQLVLKSPPNTARISELLELFPDARFIFIHRNPVEVYASTKRLWKVILENYALGAYEESCVRENILHVYDEVMQCYLDQRSMIPANRLVEVPYDKLLSNPVATIRQIYQQLDLEDFSVCEASIQAFAAQQQNYAPLRHIISPDEREMVQRQWCRYMEAWEYTEPVKTAALS